MKKLANLLGLDHVNLKSGRKRKNVYLITTFMLAKAIGKWYQTRFPEEQPSNVVPGGKW